MNVFFTIVILVLGFSLFLTYKDEQNKRQTGYELQRLKYQDVGCREYQLEIDNDSLYIYDGKRKVGAIAWDSTGAVDNLMLIDNE